MKILVVDPDISIINTLAGLDAEVRIIELRPPHLLEFEKKPRGRRRGQRNSRRENW